jgi:hypothetical protein
MTDEQIIELAKQVTGWTTHFAVPQEPNGHFYAGHHHQASVDNILRIARALLAHPDQSGDGSEKAQQVAGELYTISNDMRYQNNRRAMFEAILAREYGDPVAEIFDRQDAGFERCYEALGIADDRERSWSSLVMAISDALAVTQDGDDREELALELTVEFAPKHEYRDPDTGENCFSALGFARDLIAALASNKAAAVAVAQGERGEWFALGDGAAASLENAAVCMPDPDAKRSAEGAAAFVRKRCREILGSEQVRLMEWRSGAGLLWDMYAFGKWSKRIVSPIEWDAHTVYLNMVRAGYAKHIELRLVSSTTNASPDEPLSPVAEVCEDADGFKHIEAVIEELDDIPTGTKLYATPPAPITSAEEALYTMDQMREYADNFHLSRMRVLVAEKEAYERHVPKPEPYGYAPIHENGNYFTRNKSTADYVGGMMPVYAAAQPSRAEVLEALSRIPKTAEEMIAFIGSHFNSMEPVGEDGKPSGDLYAVKYSLTVHDLLSAFDWASLGGDEIDAIIHRSKS